MSSEIPSEVQALIDKQAINEVIMRYARGYDRLDMETLASAPGYLAVSTLTKRLPTAVACDMNL